MANAPAPPSPAELVIEERGGGAVWVVLDRTRAANALSRSLLASLRAALTALAGRRDISAVVVSGAGGKAFCAGADLKERLTMNAEETRAYLDELGAVACALEEFPMPVIAAISGAAVGGGLELALAADLRVADETATFGLAEVRLGIIPGAGGTQRLARLCGVAVAKELVLTGRRIDATTALRMGLVSAVCPPGQLRAAVASLVAELRAGAPLALAEGKRAIDRGFGRPMREALAIERECYDALLGSDDRGEGLRAFAEKRPPRFTGK